MTSGRIRDLGTLLLASAVTVMALATSGCGDSLPLTHSETPCITPGQTATIKIHTAPATELSFAVQDDFGGQLQPSIPTVTTDGGGNATIDWHSPTKLTTTTLHFLLTARKGSLRANRDIHVIVGGNGRSC
jgi:hypothetical protein